MPSVDGPTFAQVVREAEEITRLLEAHNWDLSASPQAFTLPAACDVAAKEMVFIHDGQMQTRIGRLIMVGIGHGFHLMGPESAQTEFKTVSADILDEINRQVGSHGLDDFPAFHNLGRIQAVEFVNPSMLYQARDFVFYSALHGRRIYPLAFEKFLRSFAAGKIVHNVDFTPAIPSGDPHRPAVMSGECLAVTFPTPVVEWMDKPIYGGLMRETMHIVNLLTLEPTSISHPDLPLVEDGTIRYGHLRYYLRRFAGTSPKDGVQGPDQMVQQGSQPASDRASHRAPDMADSESGNGEQP